MYSAFFVLFVPSVFSAIPPICSFRINQKMSIWTGVGSRSYKDQTPCYICFISNVHLKDQKLAFSPAKKKTHIY
jgi:hypothetical protein